MSWRSSQEKIFLLIHSTSLKILTYTNCLKQYLVEVRQYQCLESRNINRFHTLIQILKAYLQYLTKTSCILIITITKAQLQAYSSTLKLHIFLKSKIITRYCMLSNRNQSISFRKESSHLKNSKRFSPINKNYPVSRADFLINFQV